MVIGCDIAQLDVVGYQRFRGQPSFHSEDGISTTSLHDVTTQKATNFHRRDDMKSRKY
jgi:hypothetical protein